MPTAENLFKFMALRPVQKVSRDNLRRRFIKYATDSQQPQLYQHLVAQDSMTERKQVAADFILSTNYVAGFDHDSPWVDFLLSVLQSLNSLIRRQAGLGPLQTEVQDWSQQHVEQLANIKNQLWSSLYAAAISPRTQPHDRKELIDLIRIFYFLENHDSFENWQRVAELLRAKPLVPEELFVVGPYQPPDDQPNEPNPPTWQQQKLVLFKRFRDQIFGLQNAISEIETAESRSLRTVVPDHKPLPHAIVRTDQDPKIYHVASPASSLWRLDQDAIDALSPETKRVVTDNKLSLEADSTVDILNGLEMAQRELYASIYMLGGLPAVKTVGLMQMTVDKWEIPSDLLENLTDHFKNMSWLEVPPETRFDETIVGSVGSVKPVGIGDLLLVKETIWKYEMGEVAHIENVLQSESKQRVYRRLDRTQQTIFTATETTQQSERDLQTTERFELRTEVQSTLQKDSEMGLGVDVSGGYGPVKVTTSADFATSTSQSDSMSSASSYAQEITDRAVESLTERIKESVTTTLVSEIEDTNTHGFDNTDGTGHICGIYRWVDKYYLSQIYNYGKRLMFEFIVPEPASFYLQARQTKEAGAGSLSSPVPLAADFSFTDIKPGNYQTWVDAYQVANVSPPPPMYKVVGKALDEPFKTWDATPATKTDSTLTVPVGYIAKQGHIQYDILADVFAGFTVAHLTVILGRQSFEIYSFPGGEMVHEYFNTLDDEDSIVPIAINASGILSYALSIEVKCKRTDKTLEAWQLATYNAIIEAYNQQKAAYDAQLAAQTLSQGVLISGNNPDQNRRIEQEELKRGCLTLFTNQHFADFDAMLSNVAPHGYLEFDVAEAMEEARYIQFFEQAFEWDKVSYQFYPYFWARKEAWAANSQLSDVDPQFADFLKAGSARVLVPVRRNFEESIIYYLWTNPGEIWNGGEAPTINSPLYVSIVDEVMSASDADLANATPMGEPWEVKLPTDLVKLQEDGTLPDWTSELFGAESEPAPEPEP